MMKIDTGNKTVYLSVLHIWEQGAEWPELDTEVAVWFCFHNDADQSAFDDFNTYRDWANEEEVYSNGLLPTIAERMIALAGWTIRRPVAADTPEVWIR